MATKMVSPVTGIPVSAAKPYFSEQELRAAEMIRGREVVRHITPNSMFAAGLYCILAISDRWQNTTRVCTDLLNRGFTEPAYVESHLKALKENIASVRWPNKKFYYIKEFTLWWKSSLLPLEIRNDISMGRGKEFELRGRLAQDAPGLAYKSASLFMLKLGYQNIVPIDVWECRFLKKIGYDVRIGDYKTTSGPKDREYLEHELNVIRFAQELGMTPVTFHLALWGRSSGQNKEAVTGILRTGAT